MFQIILIILYHWGKGISLTYGTKTFLQELHTGKDFLYGKWILKSDRDGLSLYRKAACLIEILIPSTLIQVILGNNHSCARIKTARTEQLNPAMSTCFNVFNDDDSSSFNIGIDTNLLKTWSFTSWHCLKIRSTNSLHFFTIQMTWTVWTQVPINSPLRARQKFNSWKWYLAKTPKSRKSALTWVIRIVLNFLEFAWRTSFR